MKQTNKHTTQSNQTKHIESINEATSVQIASGTVAPSGETAMEKPKGFLRGLFDDLSMAQVIAGALAAATVFLLSSVIGVAGSLIGAAIGSVISAVSSQIYKKALSVSADKIRDAGSTSLLNGLGEDSASSSSSSMNSDAVQGLHTHGSGDGQGAQAMGTNNSSNDEATTQLRSDEATTQLCSEDGLNAATRVMNANDIRYTAPNAQEVDPALRRAHERRNRKAKVQRQVLVVSVVSSLIAIVICAGVITFATQGEGIGTKTDPILPAITNSQSYSSQEEGTSSHHNQSTANDSSASEGANTSSNSSSGSTNSLDNLELVPIKTLLREQVQRADKVQRMTLVRGQTMDLVLVAQMADLHQTRTPGQVHHLEQERDQVLVQMLLRIPGLHLVRS